MQETHFNALLMDSFKDSFNPKKVLLPPTKPIKSVKERMKSLSLKNEKDLSFQELPDYLRIPTGDELMEMRQWAIDYKKFHGKASKREVRKATQEHFKIKIYK